MMSTGILCVCVGSTEEHWLASDICARSELLRGMQAAPLAGAVQLPFSAELLQKWARNDPVAEGDAWQLLEVRTDTV